MSVTKTPEQVEKLRASAQLLSRCLKLLVDNCVPGKSGLDIDNLAEEFIRDNGATPAFKNYGGGYAKIPFPGSICFSRNQVMVHGIPKANDIIQEGDILTIDCGLELNEWYADAARLVGIGEISQEDKDIITATEAALQAGINTCKVGNKLGDVCNAIQRSIGRSKYHNVLEFCGHAIGKQMHEEPSVPNYGPAKTGINLEVGMVFCLEPMLKKTDTQIAIAQDGWTIVTLDNSRATHIEHMVLITENGPEILTI